MSAGAINEMKKLIFLENFSTPLEFMSVANVARKNGNAALMSLIENSHTMAGLRKVPNLSLLACESETRYARLYSYPRSSRQRLLVAFTGAALRMMMPLPLFIQALPKNTDLLILYDPSKNHYRSGIWDGNTTLYECAKSFALSFNAYQDAIAVGSSIGGLPAVRFAKYSGLRRGVSFGGQKIDDTLRIFRQELIPPAFDPLCACDSRTRTEAIFVYPACNYQDTLSAQTASVACNSHLIPLIGRKNHGLLWDFAKMNRLPDLLDMLFSAKLCELYEVLCSWSEEDLRLQRALLQRSDGEEFTSRIHGVRHGE